MRCRARPETPPGLQRPPICTNNSPMQEPVRISKLLSERGICSRRDADAFLARGLVLLDGQPAPVGAKALATQDIQLAPEALASLARDVTVLLHKPLGIVSGQAEDGYQDALSLVMPENHWPRDKSGIAFHPAHREHLAPAGRLDIDSTGLLVLTQNGSVARQLIDGTGRIDKEYLVRYNGVLSPHGLKMLNHGLQLDRKVLRPAIVTEQAPDTLKFILREGRKRQIRRMCELVGLRVVALKRVRIGKIQLGILPYGKWRYLAPGEGF